MSNPNAEQLAYWNGSGGLHWTRRQDLQDALLAPLSRLALDGAKAMPGEQVIDVGCGCGESSIDLAKRVAPGGHVYGIDISVPMLTRARERIPDGAPLTFIEADAATFEFQPGSVDLLFSRFGVMFFADPAAAFANMRKAMKPGGRVLFVCWRDPRENPWLMMPLNAAYKHIPRLPPVAPGSPGPFGFSDEIFVQRILTDAGFTNIRHDPADLLLDIAIGKGLEAAVQTALEMGPTSRALLGQPPELYASVASSIRETLSPYQNGETVPLQAAAWIVSAKAS